MSLADRKICTSCMSCYCSCPNNAIQIITDNKGFYYPEIDETKCTHCSICEKVCPITNYKNLLNSEIKEIYAANNKNVSSRMISSSGGIFSVLANYIITKGGYVAGVILDENLIAKHIVSNNPEDIIKMQGSKYVQSYVGDCYKTIKEHLENDKPVLFTGTPCQVAGLKSYLNKDYERLLTIDVICTCVNPAYLTKEVAKSMIDDDEQYQITNVKFRDKITGWGGKPGGEFAFSVEWNDKDGTPHKYYEQLFFNTFFNGFLNHLWMKDSCEACVYSSSDRPSDITLGDFWGIDFCDKSLNDNKGLSFTLLNTLKGKEFFKNIKQELNVCKEIDYTWAINTQPAINGVGYKKHYNTDKYFQYILKGSSPVELTKNLLGINKVGILTYDYSDNYGACLQTYALSEKIKELGFCPKIIRWSEHYKDTLGIETNNFKYFRQNYLNRSDLCYTEDELKGEISDCSKIFIGGDQVFRNWRTNEELSILRYFGDFVEGNKTLASYAASFGINFFNGDTKLKAKISKLLKRFDKISVRENSGVNILKDTFNVDSIEVLDPVFLLRKEDYEKLTQNCDLYLPDNDYIAYLYLQDNFGLNPVNRNLQESLQGENIINIATNEKGEYDSVEQWIYYIKNSKFVITDSFHCVCFAIIFKKPFVAINRNFGGNDRILNLLKKINLDDRIKNSIDEILPVDLSSEIDWGNVYSILNQKVKDAENYLLETLLLEPIFKEKYIDKELELNRLKCEKEYLKNKAAYEINLQKEINNELLCKLEKQSKENETLAKNISNLQQGNEILTNNIETLYENNEKLRCETLEHINKLTTRYNEAIHLTLNKNKFYLKYYFYRFLLNFVLIGKDKIKFKKEKYKLKIKQLNKYLKPNNDLIQVQNTKINTLKDNFEYQEFYKERYKFATKFLNFNKINSIGYLGAGSEYLREFIPANITYFSVDYLRKTGNTIIRDFNNGEFFDQSVDVCLACGLLEYIYNLPQFIGKIAQYTDCIIATYRFLELYPNLNRDILVNHYSKAELFKIFKKQGFKIILQPVFNKDFTTFIAVKKNPKFLNYELIKKYNKDKGKQ